jgi:hypothetical protein
MADLKISALTSASTPLAGTEVLPIVQSGSTVKVSVANLTAARDVAAKSVTVSGEGAYGQGKLFSTSAEGLLLQAKTGSFFDAGMLNAAGDAYAYTVAPGTINMKLWGDTILGNNSGQSHTVNGNLVQGTAAKGINFTANTPAAGMTSQLLNWYEAGTWTPTDGSGAGLTLTNNGSYYRRVGSLVVVTLDVTYPATASASTLILAGFPFIGTLVSDAAGSIAYTDYLPAVPVFLQLGSAVSGLRMLTAGAFLTNAGVSTKRFQITVSYFV